MQTSQKCSRIHRRFYRTMHLLLLLVLLLSLSFSGDPLRTGQAQNSLPWRDKGSPFGVVASLGNRVRTEDINAAVALMREAGVQWQREEIFWHEVQHTPGGPFIWTGDGSGLYNYDHAIEAQVANGIRVLGLLDYNPAWFKGKNPTLDEWLDDWGTFVYNAVARYGRDRGWIKHWELWNEPNLAKSGYESGLYTVYDFVRILEVGRAAAKAADPEAQIVMGGLASIWGIPPDENNHDYFDYLLGVAEAGGWQHVDILSIHLYRPDSPEGATGGRHRAMDMRTELDHIDEFLRKYGAKPVWITEMGWSTHQAWPGVDEDTQAFYLVRAYILAIAHPSVEKFFWYDFRNDSDPNAPYETPTYDNLNEQLHYGLLRRTYPLDPNRADLRKPSFVAYRTMTQMLGDVSLQRVMADGNEPDKPGVYWYRFGSGARNVDVIWRTVDKSPELIVPCGCQEAVVRGWNGELRQVVYALEGHIKLRLDDVGAPLYVEYDPPAAQDGEYFAVTGHTLRGAFRDFWYAHGGVERFGYPITEEFIEPAPGSRQPLVVQYFDRARFELAPVHGSAYPVQLSNIGQVSLARQGIDWTTLPKATDVTTETLFFAETGHKIEAPFRGIWEHFGGVPLMGYPLSEAFETIDPNRQRPRIMQYFERARLEYYPAYEGKPAEMVFGMLGRELYTSWGAMP